MPLAWRFATLEDRFNVLRAGILPLGMGLENLLPHPFPYILLMISYCYFDILGLVGVSSPMGVSGHGVYTASPWDDPLGRAADHPRSCRAVW